MLQLKNITKDYQAGSGVVHALKGITLNFRDSEFVSILGPSGCGKTTLLNIIGGLDQYTSGDLVINGRSTKDYKDRDWDAYRNHSIGFIFQSYNLIPHQSVLMNVELALVLSGVGKAERKAGAKAALVQVGLGDQLGKKPSEMSGGQIQRVAIARALVNNPDIILADEPTGALDTETSKQVMDILKEVSKDRLVIMVTHNPELADTYSTRIIRALDGEILSDSMPYTEDDIEKAAAPEIITDVPGMTKLKKEKKPSMSLGTSFMLSLKNLFTKKGRTILTSFAGSIGIIGIALILSVSEGTTAYINTVQEDTLASYPLQIEKTTLDLSSLMRTFMTIRNEEGSHEQDAVYKKSAIFNIMNAITDLDERENDLKSFKAFLDKELNTEDSNLDKSVSDIQYSYELPLIVYTKNVDGDIIACDTAQLMGRLMSEYMGMDAAALAQAGGSNPLLSSYTGNMTSNMNMWEEMLEGRDGALVSDIVMDQYDLVYGSWPNDENEVVIVLDENNEIDDLTLYAMGLVNEDEVREIMESDAAQKPEEGEEETQAAAKPKSWSYEEICGRTYNAVVNSDCYSYDEASGLYLDLRESESGRRYLFDNGMNLKVAGIIKPNPDASSNMLRGTICYTAALTRKIITRSQESDAISAQREDETVDVITGLPFKANTGNLSDEEKEADFRKYVEGMNEEAKAETYIAMMSIPSEEFLDQTVDSTLSKMTRKDKNETMITALTEQMGMNEKDVTDYVEAMDDEEIDAIFEEMIREQAKKSYADGVKEQMAGVPAPQLVMMLEAAMDGYTKEEFDVFYDEIMEFSDATFEDNLLSLGYVDLNDPSSISIFAKTFEAKDTIVDEIASYNEKLDEIDQIKYVDYVGLLMSSVTIIIDAITYVLIAFVAISLIVSSIMIGVITLISVQERTKEIGILRSIGASKKNVSSMFNAETLIIGFASGLVGVVITMILCVPVNLILQSLTGISSLRAFLPWQAALILIGISMLLTLIAGIIPSRSAAKKDPVVALRTE